MPRTTALTRNCAHAIASLPPPHAPRGAAAGGNVITSGPQLPALVPCAARAGERAAARRPRRLPDDPFVVAVVIAKPGLASRCGRSLRAAAWHAALSDAGRAKAPSGADAAGDVPAAALESVALGVVGAAAVAVVLLPPLAPTGCPEAVHTCCCFCCCAMATPAVEGREKWRRSERRSERWRAAPLQTTQRAVRRCALRIQCACCTGWQRPRNCRIRRTFHHAR